MDSDLILPDSMMKQEKMFAIPVYPVAKAIYDLQAKGVQNLEDFVLVVPTETNENNIGKFYIQHKSSVKQ